jgi:hypothetical protein
MVPATSQAAGNGGLPGKPHRVRPCVTLAAATLGFGAGQTAGGDELGAPGAAGDRAAAWRGIAGRTARYARRCGAPSADFSSLYDIDG